MDKNFSSDNIAGISPEAMNGLLAANVNHVPAYGDDFYTEKAKKVLEAWFECSCEIHFVLGGTAANCLSIATSVQNYHSVICHEWSHIQNDECYAPGFFKQGLQLRLLQSDDGKIRANQLSPVFDLSHGVHGTLPGLVSITQCTEGGTVYTEEEIKEIAATAHQQEMLLHMDGARFSNALVELDLTPAEMTWKAGVDIVSLGGVKNGLGFGEALVVFDSAKIDRLDYRLKQSGQLTSKMRFIGAQWANYIESGEWQRNASNANRMARLLEKEICKMEGWNVILPVQSNAVFCEMPDTVAIELEKLGWLFYPFPVVGGYRLMCSWNTEISDVMKFVEDCRSLSA